MDSILDGLDQGDKLLRRIKGTFIRIDVRRYQTV